MGLDAISRVEPDTMDPRLSYAMPYVTGEKFPKLELAVHWRQKDKKKRDVGMVWIPIGEPIFCVGELERELRHMVWGLVRANCDG